MRLSEDVVALFQVHGSRCRASYLRLVNLYYSSIHADASDKTVCAGDVKHKHRR